MPEVYITRTSSFLPNAPVSNDEIEELLGMINGQASKSRRLVLRNNGIQQRHYALDRDGNPTHTNAQLVVESIKGLFNNYEKEIKSVDLLTCGTSSPDQLMPSHGVMVHGELPESDFMDVTSPSGNCCAGMHALRYAYLSIKAGEKEKAISTGSECLSLNMKSGNFEEEVQKLIELDEKPYLAFEKDFLRWMLSDGAGAFLVQNKKNESGISLKIDWIESLSFANKEETCMYQGCEKLPDGTVKTYKAYSPDETSEQSIFSIKQDTKLLGEKIVKRGFDSLYRILNKKGDSVKDIKYFLPHLSSYFFEDKIAESLESNGMPISKEKWFTNLKNKGNVGAGSVYLMVDELFNSGKLQIGDKILLSVPESARFSYSYAMLTVC